MLFLFSLLPATILVIVGFFIVYTATRAQGGIKRFGQYLGVWVFLLAGGVIVGGVYGSMIGLEGLTGGGMSGIMEHMETMQKTNEAILQELQRD